jgi:hypothetical protein
LFSAGEQSIAVGVRIIGYLTVEAMIAQFGRALGMTCQDFLDIIMSDPFKFFVFGISPHGGHCHEQ